MAQLDSDGVPTGLRELVREIAYKCLNVADRGLTALGPRTRDVNFEESPGFLGSLAPQPRMPENRYWHRPPFHTTGVKLIIDMLHRFAKDDPEGFDRYAKHTLPWLEEQREKVLPEAE